MCGLCEFVQAADRPVLSRERLISAMTQYRGSMDAGQVVLLFYAAFMGCGGALGERVRRASVVLLGHVVRLVIENRET